MKNLLNISSLNKTDFDQIINFAKELDINNDSCLSNKNIGLIFEKNSTRTRLSFQVGIKQLKGNYIDIKLEDLNLQRFESYEDTFEIMSCYLDAIIFRTKDHKRLEKAQLYFQKPIINALSDISHPCQSISDIYTLFEHFGRNDNFNIVWMGDLNNVFFSLSEIIKFIPKTKIDVFTDKNIHINYQNIVNIPKNINFHYEIINEVLFSADCIMTDVYNSMNDKNDKENVLIKFQVNEKVISETNANTVFMHCLPAKIGSEVTKEVIKGKKSIVIKQAKNRLISQKGIMKWLDI